MNALGLDILLSDNKRYSVSIETDGVWLNYEPYFLSDDELYGEDNPILPLSFKVDQETIKYAGAQSTISIRIDDWTVDYDVISKEWSIGGELVEDDALLSVLDKHRHIVTDIYDDNTGWDYWFKTRFPDAKSVLGQLDEQYEYFEGEREAFLSDRCIFFRKKCNEQVPDGFTCLSKEEAAKSILEGKIICANMYDRY